MILVANYTSMKKNSGTCSLLARLLDMVEILIVFSGVLMLDDKVICKIG